MGELKEIRALLRGWKTYLASVPETDKDRYHRGIQACADQLEAALSTEGTQNGDD